ncbi:MAG: polysaccharide pyruvyl transferase family protein [Armatimonadetes bacterium]|nr:polysaccharide pyruvyl transferase family protein [Armatimonadota bacterium]
MGSVAVLSSNAQVRWLYRHLVRPAWWRLDHWRVAAEAALGGDVLYATWYRTVRNWGDDLNPYLIEALSQRPVRPTRNPLVLKYAVVGSSMSLVDANTIVWGAGCIHPQDAPHGRPRRVCAVRGPLTRGILLECGIDCPAVYGDPALLMPRFYDPQIVPSYAVGIVPHYVDKGHPWLAQYGTDPRVLLIDVQSDTIQFIDQIKQCHHIVSSSLHGIICADAYGIPATWVEFSDGVIGGGFKFRDYFASIGRTAHSPPRIGEGISIWSLLDAHVPYRVSIDLDALYEACPFRRE